MNTNNSLYDVKFDLVYAEKIVQNYSQSTGVDSTIIDLEGNVVFETNLTQNCAICSYIKATMPNNCFCKQSRLYGAYQAERFEGKYIFFCPIGFVNWVSPITINGIMEGAVIAGPILMTVPDKILLEDIVKKFLINKNDVDYVMNNLKVIDIIDPQKVNSMSEMLFVTSSHISDIHHFRYINKQLKEKQQSDISEYVQYIKSLDKQEKIKINYPIEKEKELIQCVKSKDVTAANSILNEILGSILFITGGSLEKMKIRILELIILLSRASLEGGGNSEEIFGLNYKYIHQVNSFTNVEDLTDWLYKITIKFSNLVFNMNEIRHIDVIYKSLDYIKRNYRRKITLEEISNYVHLSPTYFSKIFKDEMKTTFKNYLQNLRVEKSKKLLIDTQIPLIDVPNMVGFEDQSYYSKVFKKIQGISPGKFRTMAGKSI
ncbi:PocR ligand-binding domain-containing protein [Clostridium grantii]|uniref:AraC-type DNA-binding protein n=1 Tax=Clostridium grantii DSM 8605 TaxID=1121316 RepID=A0A1M5WPN7_9CLOT|nr:PocR ligand-binding domain-containing protein [Clostridium grantii]SHH89555.1 AraC-type DNA-binding protein [Clostridium grantii DSM 8605]